MTFSGIIGDGNPTLLAAFSLEVTTSSCALFFPFARDSVLVLFLGAAFALLARTPVVELAAPRFALVVAKVEVVLAVSNVAIFLAAPRFALVAVEATAVFSASNVTTFLVALRFALVVVKVAAAFSESNMIAFFAALRFVLVAVGMVTG
jgi:hypothetical protein